MEVKLHAINLLLNGVTFLFLKRRNYGRRFFRKCSTGASLAIIYIYILCNIPPLTSLTFNSDKEISVVPTVEP